MKLIKTILIAALLCFMLIVVPFTGIKNDFQVAESVAAICEVSIPQVPLSVITKLTPRLGTAIVNFSNGTKKLSQTLNRASKNSKDSEFWCREGYQRQVTTAFANIFGIIHIEPDDRLEYEHIVQENILNKM